MVDMLLVRFSSNERHGPSLPLTSLCLSRSLSRCSLLRSFSLRSISYHRRCRPFSRLLRRRLQGRWPHALPCNVCSRKIYHLSVPLDSLITALHRCGDDDTMTPPCICVTRSPRAPVLGVCRNAVAGPSATAAHGRSHCAGREQESREPLLDEMTTPSVQRAFEATMVRLRSSSTSQKLRRGGWSGGTAVTAGVVRGRAFSSKVTATAAPVPAAAVEVAGGAGREQSVEAVAPSSVGAANMPSRKKPMDGYLNKVCVLGF